MTRWPDDGADPPLEHGVDPLAAFSALMALVAAVGYLLIVNAQGSGSPVLWFLVGLLVGGGLSAYAARRTTPRRPVLLLGAGVILGLLGLLTILTIGLPILVAGCLALVAGVRASRSVRR